MVRTIKILFLIILTVVVIGCESQPNYDTIIRINPNGITERWVTYEGVCWNTDGSITFKPLELSHRIRITGNLTVFNTKVVKEEVVVIKTEKEKTK